MVTCKKYIFNFIVLIAIFLTAACASPPQVSVEALPHYDALFERHSGWTGADGAYSVSLAANRLLWLFGDTWYGEIRDGHHHNAVIVNNSIGIQRGISPPDAVVSFYSGKAPGGKPLAFIRPADGRGWFWIYDGIRVGKGLYLFLVRLERTAEGRSLGFKIIGSQLAHLTNPANSPENWRWLQQHIPWSRFSATGDTLFGSSVLKDNQFIYIYGTTEVVNGEMRRKSMILARVPATQLGQFDRWRFYSGGKWVADLNKSSRLCSDMANEFSVSYLAALGKYVLVHSEKGFSKNIVVRFAPEPWGPWSEPRPIYACPEAERSRDIFCYAAKGHPDLSTAPDEIIVTYVANSLDFDKVAADATLYRPRFLRVKFRD
jgi:hypothetical protein